MPIVAALHYRHPDIARAVEHLLDGTITGWLSLFISPRSISYYKADGYRQLEDLARQPGKHRDVESIARKCADSGAFRESFFSDELDSHMSWENNSWIIDHVTKWWPYGLDPDGTPSMPGESQAKEQVIRSFRRPRAVGGALQPALEGDESLV
jgi:hypothetical protein